MISAINSNNFIRYSKPCKNPSFQGIFHIPKRSFQTSPVEEYGIDRNENKAYSDLSDIRKLRERTEEYLKGQEIQIPVQKPEDFYIDIKGYPKNREWAEFMAETSKFAALKIKDGTSFEHSLKQIAEDYSDYLALSARLVSDLDKVQYTGVSRLGTQKYDLITPYGSNSGRYQTYYERFRAKYAQQQKKKRSCETFNPVTILHYESSKSGNILHSAENVRPGMERSREIFNELTSKYLNKPLNNKDIREINSKMAELHWFLANSTPYLRGSDCITNTFIKSLYNALGFELSPAKSGVSFDLEAFCTTKEEYIKNYTNLYQNPPKYVISDLL